MGSAAAGMMGCGPGEERSWGLRQVRLASGGGETALLLRSEPLRPCWGPWRGRCCRGRRALLPECPSRCQSRENYGSGLPEMGADFDSKEKEEPAFIEQLLYAGPCPRGFLGANRPLGRGGQLQSHQSHGCKSQASALRSLKSRPTGCGHLA